MKHTTHLPTASGYGAAVLTVEPSVITGTGAFVAIGPSETNDRGSGIVHLSEDDTRAAIAALEATLPKTPETLKVGDRVRVVDPSGASTRTFLGATGEVTWVEFGALRPGLPLVEFQQDHDGSRVRMLQHRFEKVEAPTTEVEAFEAEVLDRLPEPSALPLGYALEVVSYITAHAPKV